jgi:O-antigen chain-terminating methyltransferase
MKLAISNNLKTVPRFLYLKAITSIARSYEPYQPVNIAGKQICKGQRHCQDRWPAIHEVLKASGVRSVLDLGSAEGYFVDQAARSGYIALGVDADVRRMSLAQASITMNAIEGGGYMFGNIGPSFFERLPSFDAVLLLSVLHHVMYEHGLEYSREYMAALRRKVGSVLLFDMGQSNETENAWAARLPDMGPDPHAWIASFLRSAGFGVVEKLSDTDAYQGPVNRALFKCIP